MEAGKAQIDRAELQHLLDEVARNLGVVGAQLAIYDGLEQLEFVTGHRNWEQGLPVTPDTLFQIGSTTKLFNSALIMSLVDRSKLDLDVPVQQYLPEFRLADAIAQKTVTLRQLLSMTSGLDNGPYYDYGRGDDALGRYVEVLAGIPQIFEPGSAYGYSNASTAVAGYTASRVLGRTWEHLVSECLWAPLGMHQSALFAEDLLQHPLALGYQRLKSGCLPERLRVWSNPRSQAPAGSLTCSSAGDLVRFARMLLGGGKAISGIEILSRGAVEAMHAPIAKLPSRMAADEWCMGPSRRKWGNDVLYGHGGTNLSGSSMLLWCPDKNVAIATVVNVPEQGLPFADAIFDAVLPRYFQLSRPATPTPCTVTRVEVDLKPYAGRFEAFGMTHVLSSVGKKISLTCRYDFAPQFNVTECELIPLGENRFLPCDPRVLGNRNWDLAFWGTDEQGRATHLLVGIFPLRRTN